MTPSSELRSIATKLDDAGYFWATKNMRAIADKIDVLLLERQKMANKLEQIKQCLITRDVAKMREITGANTTQGKN